MNRIVALLSALVLAPLHSTLAAPYAVSVVDYYNPGTGPFTDPAAALGAPDAPDDLAGLYSMGPYGYLELQLGQPVFDIPGIDFAVWEESTYFDFSDDPFAAFPDEDADVYLSFDAINWTLIGQARRGVVGSLVYDIAGKGVDGATYARIVDVSGGDSTNYEGFDLDAVMIMEASVVPIPAAAWLFGSALGLLGWMRHRRN